jgi:hypothetical protein
MEVGYQDTNHQESGLTTKQLLLAFGCLYYSSIDCLDEEGAFVLKWIARARG